MRKTKKKHSKKKRGEKKSENIGVTTGDDVKKGKREGKGGIQKFFYWEEVERERKSENSVLPIKIKTKN